jgi:hypothetical protein
VKTPAELIEAYARAYEAVGGHPNRAARGLGIATVLELVADDIDLGPDVPLPPSVYSALLREKADDIRQTCTGAGVDHDG